MSNTRSAANTRSMKNTRFTVNTHSEIFADLHTHSSCSDGLFEPEEMVEQAAKMQLGALAISDHDNFEGAKRLLQAAKDINLIAIPAVELSTQYDDRQVHMLGYFCDFDNKDLQQLFEESNSARKKRTLQMAANLEKDGYPVHPDELQESGEILNSTLIARRLVSAGLYPNVDDVIEKLIGFDCPYYVKRNNINSIEAIKLIEQAGGSSFIAHPAAYEVTDLIPVFAKNGLTGLEAYYPLHSASEQKDLLALAKELNIGVSGGSDWHGDNVHHSSLAQSGLEKGDFIAFLDTCKQDIDSFFV